MVWLLTARTICLSSDEVSGNILKFTPSGVRTTFASRSGLELWLSGHWPPSSAVRRAAVSDFNGDGHPDYVLYERRTRQTAIWYLNNNVFISGASGPTLPAGWGLRGVADFNRDGHPDYGLFNSATRQTAIWYLSGPTLIGGAYGPSSSQWLGLGSYSRL